MGDPIYLSSKISVFSTDFMNVHGNIKETINDENPFVDIVFTKMVFALIKG